jgi:gliding motility-associated-like protein
MFRFWLDKICRKQLKRLLLYSLLIASFIGNAQIVTNKGTDFWVGYGHHQYMEPTSCTSGAAGPNDMNMRIYLSNTEATTATVTVTLHGSGLIPSQWYRKPYTIPPFTVIETENMPKGIVNAAASGSDNRYDARLWSDPPPAGTGGEGIYTKKGIHIESDVPIVAYAHIYGGVSSGATMLLPTDTWGYSYASINSEQGGGVTGCFSWMYVIAKDDNTVVEITPSQTTRLGKPAGVPFQVTLNKGEIYQLVGQAECTTGAGVQLTGTKVRSVSIGAGDCKPIAVFSGSSRTGGEAGFCGSSGRDNDMQQCFPQHAWGKRYLTAPWSKSSGGTLQPTQFQNNVFKILVKDPTTVVRRNGNILGGLIGGAYYAYTSSTADYIESDKPIMIAQFMSNGSACNTGDGDPEMVFLSPIEQGIKTAGFYRTNLQAINSNYITLIVPTLGVPSLRIDGSATFNHTYPHPNRAGYTVVIKGWAAAKAQSIVKCDSSFVGVTYGMGGAESYGYNAGTQLNNLNAIPGYYNPADTSGVTVVHPNAFVNTPTQLGAYVVYKPTKMVWKVSSIGCSNITPCTDVTINNPTPIDSIIVGAGKFYLYRLPGTYLFNKTGTFYLPIVLTSPNLDNGNCSNEETVSIEIIVKEKPTATFTYTQGVGCGLDYVNFTSPTTTAEGYTIIKRKWFFTSNPADTSNLQNPSFYFPTAGTYPVKLEIITQYGGVKDTTINVIAAAGSRPNSSYTAVPTTICVGQQVVFTPTSSVAGTTGWYWDFGFGSPQTIASNAVQTITYNAAGTFTVKHSIIGASFSCPADTIPTTIIVAATPVIAASSATAPTTCGGTNGSISLSGLLNNTPYTVNYTFGSLITVTLSSNASGVLVIPNLSAGTYTNLTVTIGTCTSAPIASVVLNNPNAPTAPAISSNSPICSGATLNLTSGISIATVTYEWTGPNGFTSNLPNPTINPATTAAAGTYSLIVKDIISGCSSVATTTTVVVNAIPLIGSTSSSNPTTCATVTGSITLNGLLSNTAYIVNYTINSTVQTVTLTSDGFGVLTIPNLSAGTYSNITVTLNTCISTAVGPISLSDPNPPATPVASVLVSPICAGNTINLSASSATTGVTLTWSGPNSFSAIGATASITSATTAASGTYSVVAKLNGCTSLPGTVNVTVNPIPATPTVASNSPICAGSNLNLTSSGVTGTAIYNWTGPNTFISSNANPTITAATTVATGSYDLTVTQNGCPSASGSVSVVVNAVPVITSSSLTNTTTCATATGTILLNGLLANTSYTVNYTAASINQTATIISGATGSLEIPNLLAGTYSNVSVTLNNCTSNVVGPFTITDPTPPPTPTIVSNNSPVCSGSAINLTAGSTATSATFTWTTPSGTNITGATLTVPSATASDAGTYSVKITVNSCNSSPITTNVFVKQTPIVSSSNSTNPTTCATATGSITLNGLIASTSYAVAYSKNGVAQTATLIANASGIVTISNLSAATYANVTLTLNGCTSTAVGPFVLSDPNPPATPTIVSVPSATICTGDNLTLTASTTTAGTIVYNWSANNGFIPTTTNPIVFNNALAAVAGTYSVTATLNSCTSAAGQVTVVVNPTPIITTGIITNPTDCASTTGSIALNGLSNNSTYTVNYTINTSVQTVTLTSNALGVLTIPSLSAGTYSNISVTLNGCPSNIVGPFTLTDPAAPGVSIVTNNSPLCEGATLNIVASSAATGVSFTWTSTNGYTNVGSTVSINAVTTLSSGTYTVTAIKNNCASTANAVVSVKPYPITAFTTSPFVCMPNGVVSFTNLTTVPDGSTPTYVWNFGDGSPVDNTTNPTHIYATSISYTISLTATGGNGCSKIITKSFDKFYDKPLASFKADRDTLCLGPTSMFKDLSTAPNSSIKSWLWDFADGTISTIQDPNKKFNLPGSYNVRLIVRSQENCVSDTSKKQIRVYQQPIIDAGQSFTVPVGTSIVFNPTANDSTGVSFLWTPSSHFVKADTLRPTLIVKGNQIYYLTAKGEWKCTASDSLKVIALKLLKIPNAFTPNGDNIHDKWEIDELRDFPFAEVEVFNRNGQLVYHSSGYSNPWDGTLNGKPLPVGTYYYIIDLKNNFPKQAGFVTLLR